MRFNRPLIFGITIAVFSPFVGFAQNSPLPPIGSVSPQSQSCMRITRNLSTGSRGSDVIQLQQYLISQSLLNSDSATGYFGKLTEAAVQKWQASRGIVSSGSAAETGYGAVGPKTRLAIERSCSGQSPTVSTNTNISPSTNSGQANSNQSTIDALLAQIKALQDQLNRLISGNTTTNTSTNTNTSPSSCS